MIDKELQSRTWQVLPKEFKEEVSDKYIYACEYCEEPYWYGVKTELEYFFGIHNLTSDAEPEEMLMVPRKDIVKIFAAQTEVQKSLSVESIGHHVAAAQTEVLYNLFGSKCLPDLSEVKRDLSVNLSDQKPAEPKFKLKDRVVRKYVSTIRTIVGIDSVSDETGTSYYYMTEDSHGNNRMEFIESDLEPYTEPEEKTSPNDNHSDINIDELVAKGYLPDPAKHFDTILKDSFRNERRLNIAAQIASGICSSPNCVDLAIFNRKAEGEEHIAIAQYAIKIADTLIAECEKGGNHEKA